MLYHYLFFSQYPEKLIQMTTNMSLQQTGISDGTVSGNIKDIESREVFGYKNQE